MIMSTEQPPADLLDEHAVARMFMITRRTLRRWIARGIAPPHARLGRKRWWRREAIMAHLAAHETSSGHKAPPRRRRALKLVHN